MRDVVGKDSWDFRQVDRESLNHGIVKGSKCWISKSRFCIYNLINALPSGGFSVISPSILSSSPHSSMIISDGGPGTLVVGTSLTDSDNAVIKLTIFVCVGEARNEARFSGVSI